MLKNKKAIGLILLVFVVFLISVKVLANIKSNNQISIEVENDLIKSISNITSPKLIEKAQVIDYIAYLKIPKINLNKGLVSKESELNHVDTNIQILKEADMPDIINGNLILASHSGNSNVSYFKDLHKLELNDSIYIEYNNKDYEYKVVNYYIVEKTGLVNIVRNKNKTSLTLITCIENTNKQLVIICEVYKITNL